MECHIFYFLSSDHVFSELFIRSPSKSYNEDVNTALNFLGQGFNKKVVTLSGM